METNQKNNQQGQGTTTDSKTARNQYHGNQNIDKNQSQDYSKNSPQSDDQTSSDTTGNRSKNINNMRDDKKKLHQKGGSQSSSATMADDDDDITAEGPNTRKEYDDTGHKHDYKTPLDSDSKDMDLNKNQIKNGMNQKAGANNQNAKKNDK